MSVCQFQQKKAQSIIGRRGFKFIKKRVTISFQGKYLGIIKKNFFGIFQISQNIIWLESF